MTNIGHIGLSISMTLFLLLPAFVMAQSPFRYLPPITNSAPSAGNAVDIVAEPQTYTPHFYQGRAEPISGSRLKLVAIPHGEIAAEAASYRWQIAGRNLSNAPEAKLQTVTIDVPVASSLTVKVEVFDQAGKILATKTDSLTIGDMELAFYENNALRGLSKVAITDELIMVGDEVGVTAIPYFSDPGDLNGNLRTSWLVGNQPQAVDTPWEVTLKRSELTRDVLINFDLRNHRTLESANETFTLKL